MHRYSVDIFPYSAPSGILSSKGKQNTAKGDPSGRENCYTFQRLYEQTQKSESAIF